MKVLCSIITAVSGVVKPLLILIADVFAKEVANLVRVRNFVRQL